MNLDDLSIDDLAELHRTLGVIHGAAEMLACLPGDHGAVRISLQPGELVTLSAAWVMPACGGCLADGIDFVIEDHGGGSGAPQDALADVLVPANLGGSGGLQRVDNAERPPAEPAASTPESGASPEVAPVVADPSVGAHVPLAPAEVPLSSLGGGHGQH